MLGLVKNLKIKFNLQIQYTGKNQAFKRNCNQEFLEINFEYTALGTPQPSGQVEQKFASLLNSLCTLINGGKFTTYLQKSLRSVAANTTTLLRTTF